MSIASTTTNVCVCGEREGGRRSSQKQVPADSSLIICLLHPFLSLLPLARTLSFPPIPNPNLFPFPLLGLVHDFQANPRVTPTYPHSFNGRVDLLCDLATDAYGVVYVRISNRHLIDELNDWTSLFKNVHNSYLHITENNLAEFLGFLAERGLWASVSHRMWFHVFSNQPFFMKAKVSHQK